MYRKFFFWPDLCTFLFPQSCSFGPLDFFLSSFVLQIVSLPLQCGEWNVWRHLIRLEKNQKNNSVAKSFVEQHALHMSLLQKRCSFKINFFLDSILLDCDKFRNKNQRAIQKMKGTNKQQWYRKTIILQSFLCRKGMMHKHVQTRIWQ